MNPPAPTSSPSARPTPERIFQLAFGYGPPIILDAAIEYGVFDHLVSGPRTLDQLVTTTSTSRRGLRGVLDALVGLGFLLKNSEGAYLLTPESDTFLVSGKATYFGGLIRHGVRQILPQWQALRDVVRTGQPARGVNEQVAGGEFFEHFVEDLFPMNYPAAQALATEWKIQQLSSAASALDLAAGSGVWGIALAQRSPHLRVTAVDWPVVLKVTHKVVERFKLTPQFSFLAGDILEIGFGAGHQFATLGHILHSEGEARSRKLLKKVYDALAPGGQIGIGEFLPNVDRSGPPQALIFAVNMLVNTAEGDTFTFEEISAWLSDAGFKAIRQVEAPSPSPLILAVK